MTTKKIKIVSFCLVVILAIGGILLLTHRSQAPGLLPKNTSVTIPIVIAKPDPVPEFDKSTYSLSDPESIWLVVNKIRPLNPLTYAPQDLQSVGNGQMMRKVAVESFIKLQAGAKAAGLTITALSGYRSYATQISVYNAEVKNYGKDKADTESARPGTSEHQTGLAVDVGGGGCGVEDCFGETAEGKWLFLHAYEYGFIVRYTGDKQTITGYRAEPWHIRYIGSDLSEVMHKKTITTLEEFFNLPAAPDYK